MRPQLVAQCVDQRVQTATTATSVVETPAAICADIRTAVGAASATAACGAVAVPPGLGSGSSAVGLGGDLTAPTASSTVTISFTGRRTAGNQRQAKNGFDCSGSLCSYTRVKVDFRT
jgi:hypothetical protein